MIRRRSPFGRLLDALPLVLVLGIALAGVFVAMNVLIVAAPVLIASPGPSVSVEPSLLGSPSLLPSVTPPVSPSAFPTAVLPSDKPVVIRSAISAVDPGRVWTLYLEYPSFQPGTTPWATEMNADIADEMQTRAAQWELGPASVAQVAGRANVLSGTFKVDLLTAALASFTITWIDQSTATTPANNVETINFDLSNGQRLDFDSMFTDTAAALATISSSAQKQLVDVLGPNFDDAVVTDGIQPARSSFVNWALTTTGLKITFAEGQVSLSVGLYSVVIPWSELRPVMASTGPVAALAGVAP
jgi:hypothetical protein